jgi:hypothetical protein
MPDRGARVHAVVAGPLRVEVSDSGRLRIGGWDEPDWFGPARLVAPDATQWRLSAPAPCVALEGDWLAAEVRAVPEEAMVVLGGRRSLSRCIGWRSGRQGIGGWCGLRAACRRRQHGWRLRTTRGTGGCDCDQRKYCKPQYTSS